MLRYKLVSIGFVAVLFLSIGAGTAFANAIVIYDAANSGFDQINRWWVYSYVVANVREPEVSGDNLFWFALSGLQGTLGPEPAPPGWTLFLSSGYADWIADFGSEIAPGDSLGGFSFHSTTSPGIVNWEVFGDGGSDATGQVVGPVPEPASAALFLVGLLPVGLAWRRRRKS